MVIVVTVLLLAVGYLCFGMRFRCRGPTNRGTPCKLRPRGLFGRCASHGRLATIAHFSGARTLDKRATCACGKGRVLRRARATGALFLGCSGFPGCMQTLEL